MTRFRFPRPAGFAAPDYGNPAPAPGFGRSAPNVRPQGAPAVAPSRPVAKPDGAAVRKPPMPMPPRPVAKPQPPVDPGFNMLPGRRPLPGPVRQRPSRPAAMASGGHAKKGAAKVEKVMGEYKRGELHSGSKKGPVVKSRKQAVAIAMNEAGMAKPGKKSAGGALSTLPGAKAAKTATHAHERAMHPGKPMTRMARGGGVPVASRSPMIGKKGGGRAGC